MLALLARQKKLTAPRRYIANLAQIINGGIRPKNGPVPGGSVGLFGYDQLREPIGFETLTETALNRTEFLRQKVINLPKQTTKANVVELFDEMSDSLCQVADLAEFVRLAHPNAEFRRAAQNSCAKIGRYVEELNTDVQLYQSFKGELGKLSDPVDARVGQLFLLDFEQSGIHLPEDQRANFVATTEKIHTLGSIFQQNVDMPTIVKMSDIPKPLGTVLARYFTHDEQTNSMAVDRFLADATDRSLREITYRLFYEKSAQVDDVIKLLVKERHALAQLSGFSNFATRTISPNTLAGNVDFVSEVVSRVSEAIHPVAERALSQMSVAMKSDGITQPIAPWDVIYYTKKLRDAFADDEAYRQLREYLNLGSTLGGLDQLFSRLYDVHLKLETPLEGEVWSSDVIKLAVVNSPNGQTLGHIFLDVFERANKPIMECHFTIRGGRLLPNGSYQTPVVVLMLNFEPPGRRGTPTLLSLGQIENLFHEFGHAMHSILGRTKYQHVTGTRCPTDFAEVPSVLMESFADDPRVAALYATHYETGKPAPSAALHAALSGARSSFRLVDLQQQLIYTDFDLKLHSSSNGSSVDDAGALYAKVYEQHTGIAMPIDVAQYQRFAHLVGYGSRYYSYLLSRAVAGLLWRQMFKDDPLCLMSQSGAQFRKRLLEHGGMVEPRRLVESTLGISSLSAADVANAITQNFLQNTNSNQAKTAS